MNVLHVISSIDPALGGVVEAVRGLCIGMATAGHRSDVACSDSENAAFKPHFPARVYALGPVTGKYAYNSNLSKWLAVHAPAYDAVIVHGLWQFHSLAAWRALRNSATPYFVFTHGMLDPWFKRRYPLKHLKKWLYWPWADYRVLRDAQAVLFTSQEECQQARKSFWLYRCRERVASLGILAPGSDIQTQRGEFLKRCPEAKGKRVLLFLGRLDVKKGCDLVVEAFARVAQKAPHLHLVMAGPDHSSFGKKVRESCRALGISDRVSWPGMLTGPAKWGAYRCADGFILPSHQENFGFAVVEALSCGVPVLISNKICLLYTSPSPRD